MDPRTCTHFAILGVAISQPTKLRNRGSLPHKSDRAVACGVTAPRHRSALAQPSPPLPIPTLNCGCQTAPEACTRCLTLHFCSPPAVAKSYGVPVANVDYLAAVFMVAPLIFCASSRSVCPLSPESASLPRLCNDQGPLSDPRSFWFAHRLSCDVPHGSLWRECLGSGWPCPNTAIGVIAHSMESLNHSTHGCLAPWRPPPCRFPKPLGLVCDPAAQRPL